MSYKRGSFYCSWVEAAAFHTCAIDHPSHTHQRPPLRWISARVLSIPPPLRSIDLHLLWPIKTLRPTCGNQDVWAFVSDMQTIEPYQFFSRNNLQPCHDHPKSEWHSDLLRITVMGKFIMVVVALSPTENSKRHQQVAGVGVAHDCVYNTAD